MNYYAFIIACAFIAFDFITGLVKAFATGNYKSTKMRQGLFHKVGLLLCVVLGYLVDFSQAYLDLGITIPVANAICVYISIMEISSVLENLCAISPELMPDKLNAIFGSDVIGDAPCQEDEDDDDQ